MTVITEPDLAERAARNVRDNLPRLTVEIEDLDDIVADIDQSLSRA